MSIFKTFLSALQIKGEKVKNLGNIVQNDRGSNKFILRLSDGTKPVDLTDYSVITVTVVKPDKTLCVDSTPCDRIEVLDEYNGEISIVLHDNAIDVAGECTATVEVYEDDRKMSSARFMYTVTPDLAEGADPTGEASFPVLQNLVSHVSSVLAKETAKVTILDMFDTLDELMSSHPRGTAGDAYIVGTSASNETYIWSESKGAWVSAGGLNSKFDLLWENPNPTGEFASQTITVRDITQFRILIVISETCSAVIKAKVNCSGYLTYINSDMSQSLSSMHSRRCDITGNTSIKFISNTLVLIGASETGHKYQTANGDNVPLYVYGIK